MIEFVNLHCFTWSNFVSFYYFLVWGVLGSSYNSSTLSPPFIHTFLRMGYHFNDFFLTVWLSNFDLHAFENIANFRSSETPGYFMSIKWNSFNSIKWKLSKMMCLWNTQMKYRDMLYIPSFCVVFPQWNFTVFPWYFVNFWQFFVFLHPINVKIQF